MLETFDLNICLFVLDKYHLGGLANHYIIIKFKDPLAENLTQMHSRDPTNKKILAFDMTTAYRISQQNSGCFWLRKLCTCLVDFQIEQAIVK